MSVTRAIGDTKIEENVGGRLFCDKAELALFKIRSIKHHLDSTASLKPEVSHRAGRCRQSLSTPGGRLFQSWIILGCTGRH